MSGRSFDEDELNVRAQRLAEEDDISEERTSSKQRQDQINQAAKRATRNKNYRDSSDTMEGYREGRVPVEIDQVDHQYEMYDLIIRALKNSDMVFMRGHPVRVGCDENGPRFVNVNKRWLPSESQRVIQFRKTNADGRMVPSYFPEEAAAQAIALMDASNLNVVLRMSVSPAPYYTSSGEMKIVREPGYHKESRLYILESATEGFDDIKDNPTKEDVIEAVRTLWYPAHLYLFPSNDDKAAVMAQFLTAVVRPVLDTAPGFAANAPMRGSGKTKLNQAAAILATGHKAPACNYKVSEEGDKAINAQLKSGRGVILVDNISKTFKSDKLASAITGESVEERRLYSEEMVSVPTNCLVLINGNNLEIDPDMRRRFIVFRIDTKSESPWSNQFEFDPEVKMLEMYKDAYCAAINILRYHNNLWMSGKRSRGVKKVGSFDKWSEVVLDCVDWLGEFLRENEDNVKELCPDDEWLHELGFGNIRKIIEGTNEEDPEKQILGEFLDSAYYLTCGASFVAPDLLAATDLLKEDEDFIEIGSDKFPLCRHYKLWKKMYPDKEDGEYMKLLRMVKQSIEEIDWSGKITPRKFGRWLGRSKDNPVGGFKLVDSGFDHHRVKWIIERVGDNEE